MSDEAKVLFGVEYTHSAIRVSTSLGHRSMITGRFEEPEQWLGHLFYGISIPSGTEVRGVLAMPVNLLREQGPEIAQTARAYRFERVLACSACYALARAPGQEGEMLAVHVTPEVSSVAIVGVGLPGHEEEDFVRPIAGREAREIAVSLRCLVKALPRERRRALLDRVVVGGDTEAIEQLGRLQIEKELWDLGAVPEFVDDAHAVASGALQIAGALRGV